MNIRNRLKKLEVHTGTGADFCRCKQNQWAEMYVQDLTQESKDTEPRLNGNTLPDNCASCSKPIEKKTTIFQLCDDSTEDRHPELLQEPSLEATFKIK